MRAIGGDPGRRRCIGHPAFPALAGPPYVTDDPEPAAEGRWEIYAFATDQARAGDIEGQSGLDINYGLARDVQLSVTLSVNCHDEREGNFQKGMGDFAAGLKLLLVHQRDHGVVPDIAIFPTVLFPTGSARMGAGHRSLSPPVWLGKDFGPWGWTGGASYTIGSDPERKGTLFLGTAVTRAIWDRLSIGGEIFHGTPEERDAGSETGFNAGITYALTRHYAVVASA